jgi:hypothetical protein
MEAESLSKARDLLDWWKQRENPGLTFWPELGRAGDQLEKTVPRPPELQAAIGLVAAAFA